MQCNSHIINYGVEVTGWIQVGLLSEGGTETARYEHD